LNDLFKCKDCGAPRSYINQYCPICESSGPHIPAGSKTTRSRPPKRRVNAEAKWWDDIETDEKPDVKKRKDTRNDHKDIRKYSASDFKSNSKTADDTDIRSSLDTRSSIKPISGKTWGYISLAVVAVIVLVLISLNMGTFVEQWTGNINQIGKWFAFHPAPTTATALTNPVENKTSNPVNNPTPTGTQAPTTSPGNATVNPPQPDKDTTKPVLTDKPVSVPGDTSVTIAWKTDEKATSLVKYGTDASCPFPSS